MATHTLDWQDAPPDSCRGAVVTVGNFDGVHRGHAALLAAARDLARPAGAAVVALTFDPHPLDVLRPSAAPPVLTPPAERARLLHAAGADEVVLLRTTPGLLALDAAAFFRAVLVERLAVRGLVEGHNFAFGKDRQGTTDTLRGLCAAAGVELAVVPPQMVQGAEVSSSRVRALLGQGAVADAAGLLGRPYRLAGTVGPGARRGAALGFPTANLHRVTSLVPGDGVYAMRAWVGDAAWPAAGHVGPNATFGEDARTVEVHLIGFQGDLYGRELRVDFLTLLRGTRRFAGTDELLAQMRRDVDEARRVVTRAEETGP